MASLLQFICILLLAVFVINCMASNPSPQHYIVYMGSSWNADRHDESSYVHMLSSLIPSEESERRLAINSYSHAFKGFSAMLTESEVSALSGYDEVVSVFPDPILQLHTTRSWDFLEEPDENLRSRFPVEGHSADVIIGIIDTGIWPESPSFNDHGIGKIPSKWKGVCMEGSDFKKSNCNRKLIGARYYSAESTKGSARDSVGHGTHTASTAGGSSVANASYYGLGLGVARGGLPSARIASYKACTEAGCSGSIILKAIDDAIKDGVDIISISVGSSSMFQSDFLNDPLAIGAFHAEQMGVPVVCSAGNEGPDSYTVVNTAPWIFTVAASTSDRDFRSTIVLGNNESYQGSAISFSSLRHQKQYPLTFGEKAASSFTSVSDASNCVPGSLDLRKTAGKIVVCMNDELSVSRMTKRLVAEDAKAIGVIILDGDQAGAISPFDAGTYPYAEIRGTFGSRVLHYINSTKNPYATILPATEIRKLKPAPIVASFSSRGPGSETENILKPDIMAPGVAILAAYIPKIQPNYDAPGNKPSTFSVKSGTSMACPHVTGAMAFVKSVHPFWSSSIIKSALITTASSSNNMGGPLTNGLDNPASPHEVGAGEIRPIRALDPGLVFKTTINDHLTFLCYLGYNQKSIRSMSNTNFSCPKNSTARLISNINYPTISIGGLNQHDGPKMVRRVVTNVGSSPNVTYVASVNAPKGLLVKVVPTRIVFTPKRRRASFRVFFDGKEAAKGYKYGDVTWSDGSHIVRSVFAVNVV